MTNLPPTTYDLVETPFTDEGFHAHYEAIQREINKHDTLSIIDHCLRFLHEPASNNFVYLQRHPWLVLLLMKWTILAKRAFKHGRSALNAQQFNELAQMMYDLGERNATRMPSQFQHIRLFFRAIAYQQFIFQRDSNLTVIARQHFYFDGLAPQSYIASTFQRLTGISIPRFLGLAQALFIRFSEGPQTHITAKWFDSLQGAYSRHEVDAFLRALSKSLTDVRQALLDRDKDNISKGRPARSPTEYWEQTPFINYPLISMGSKYIIWDRYVLLRCIEHFIYNVLRAHNAKVFMAHFGPLFEQYVERAIVHIGLPYVTEKELKTLFGEESDAIDFIIPDGEANIFLDAKGAEMSYQGKSTHESDELARWLETSALKAIKQAHKIMSKLPESGDDSVLLRRRTNNYLITVTYSELYVGSGRTLAEAIGKEKLKPLMKTPDGISPIPLENMYFMTVQDFELLAEAVRSGQATLTQLLNHAIAEDNAPQTQKFEFGLHLSTAGITVKSPEYLVSLAMANARALADQVKT